LNIFSKKFNISQSNKICIYKDEILVSFRKNKMHRDIIEIVFLE